MPLGVARLLFHRDVGLLLQVGPVLLAQPRLLAVPLHAVSADIMGSMTAERDELRRMVEQLPEEQVPAALVEVQRLASAPEPPAWPPPWFAAVTSGRADTAARVDDLLAEGFGG